MVFPWPLDVVGRLQATVFPIPRRSSASLKDRNCCGKRGVYDFAYLIQSLDYFRPPFGMIRLAGVVTVHLTGMVTIGFFKLSPVFRNFLDVSFVVARKMFRQFC